MGRRALPAGLVVIAAFADSRGAHALALDALLGAVAFASVAALASFAHFLDTRDDPLIGLQSALWALAVGLLVLSCAMRSSALQGVPRLAESSLIACLAIFGLKSALTVAPYMRRLGDMRPAKP